MPHLQAWFPAWMSRTRMLRWLIALTAASLPATTLADIYKWVDAQGQVHYGSQPAAGNPSAEKLKIQPLPTTRPRISKEALQLDAINHKEAEAARKQREARQPRQVQPKIPAAEKRRLCRQAKNDIQAIQSRGRMREINAQGAYTYLSEKQRQQRLSAARKRRSKYCH